MSRTGAALRLGFYYAALFCAVGIHMPYWPLWLKDRGLTPSDIGLIMAATYLTKIIISPLIGHWADRTGARRAPMTMLAAGAAATWLLFSLVDGFAGIMLVTMLAVGLWSGVFPLGESLAMAVTHRRHIDYGRVRLWGSLSFIALAVGFGAVMQSNPPSVLQWAVPSALAVLALSCALLPDQHEPGAPRPPAPPTRLLLTDSSFLLFIFVVALSTASHTVYYAFASIHWRGAGIDSQIIGLLWAEGVIAEVMLFAFSGYFAAKLGPHRLLMLGTAAAIIRWGVLGATTDTAALAAVQWLHACTFGCTHLGAMHYIQRHVPPGLSARAQALLSAAAMGIAPGLMSPFAGDLYESIHGGAFWVMAAMAAAGLAASWALLRLSGKPRQAQPGAQQA